MNSSIYVFGYLGNRYSQYPNDYTVDIFQDFQQKAIAQSQIIIHRHDSLMYYGYIRKLDTDAQYIGFCILLNGVMFSRSTELFPIFENAVSELALKGEILKLQENGNLTSSTNDLRNHPEEVGRIGFIINSAILSLKNEIKTLPPICYSTENKESITFSIKDNDKEIAEAPSKYSNIFILKEIDYNSQALQSATNIIKKLHKEKNELSASYQELKESYYKLKGQKKQYKNIAYLCILLTALGLGLISLKGSLATTENNLKNANKEIEQKADSIKILVNESKELETSLFSEQSKRIKAENESTKWEELCKVQMPIIINSIEIANANSFGTIVTSFGNAIYSNQSMYLKPRLVYTGIDVGNVITLEIKLYTPEGHLSQHWSSPKNCSWSESFEIQNGTNTKTLLGWGSSQPGHWDKGNYRIEFWHNNKCLKAKSFTIY